ncbi:MAG: divalent cation tolerance protein CutA [Thaumarchaeota archaeon]|jgi:periplasmic divalent cation tolerance protein|nr:divalent cation tolerance protein CutA [Nitrososphaerota archaeon]
MVKTVVLVSCETESTAKIIASQLISNDMVVSVSIINEVKSITRGEKGELVESNQNLLLAETDETLLPKLVDFITSISNYKPKKIIALPISGGSWDYLDWISRVTSKKNNDSTKTK